MNSLLFDGGPVGFPPWLRSPLTSLVALVQSRQPPPALLVTGPEGIGKGVLVRTFLQRIACTEVVDTPFPCGSCNGCRSFLSDSHPEILRVAPEEPGKEILIERIRGVSDFLSLSHNGPARLVSIAPAESMTMNAANALLKTLEEPPGGSMILLVAARPARLTPTIRSRCRLLRIPPPASALVRQWLSPAAREGLAVDEALVASLDRPMAAHALLDDPGAIEGWRQDREALETLLEGRSPFSVVERFQACDLRSLLPRLQRLLVSAQTCLITDEPDGFGRLFQSGALERFARARGAKELARLFQDSLQWHRDLPTALNPQLRCESVVLRFWRRDN
jgi:DNA polymerase III subunit delta'